jgi:hypothetical protein
MMLLHNNLRCPLFFPSENRTHPPYSMVPPTQEFYSMAPKRSGRATGSERRATVELYLSMSMGFPFQHWTLFIDDPDDPTIVNVQGSFTSGWTFEEMHNHDPRNAEAFVEMHHIATIYKDQVVDLTAIAQSVPLTGQTDAWDCQHWVIDVLRLLDAREIISISDAEFTAFCLRVESVQKQ